MSAERRTATRPERDVGALRGTQLPLRIVEHGSLPVARAASIVGSNLLRNPESAPSTNTPPLPVPAGPPKRRAHGWTPARTCCPVVSGLSRAITSAASRDFEPSRQRSARVGLWVHRDESLSATPTQRVQLSDDERRDRDMVLGLAREHQREVRREWHEDAIGIEEREAIGERPDATRGAIGA